MFVKIAEYDENLKKQRKISDKKLILFGISYFSEMFFPYFPHIDYYCDFDYGEKKDYHGIRRITIEEMVQLKERVDILFAKTPQIDEFERFCIFLIENKIKAKVYNLFLNAAFPFLEDESNYSFKKKNERLRVRIVNYDRGWILSKFAERMNECLLQLGVDSDIAYTIDTKADINHHIPYHPFQPLEEYNDTLMITHVDTGNKIKRLKKQLETAKMGICMSLETVGQLAANGVARRKLCYINPAHDNNMKPKKYVLGITHRCYDDYDFRKRTAAIIDICKPLNPNYFKLKIMGAGWEKIVAVLRDMGFEVEYENEFDYDKYHDLIPSLDYYIFFGFDEGSMGYLDALAAGVQTIVTPQGFHLDVQGGIDYPCRNVQEFSEVLLSLQKEREQKVKAVENWNWKNYALKHLEVWNYITRREPLSELYKNQLKYNDGIFSVLLDNNMV